MEIPLGIEVHAESYGLNVVYETNDPANTKSLKDHKSSTSNSRSGTPDLMN
jgi:hypothetical protein